VREESAGADGILASIERLDEAPAARLADLLAESHHAGLGFVRRLADEWASGANRFDRPGEALFIARTIDRIVGVGGLNIDPYATTPEVGRVRHLYVLRAYRRLGIGRRLVTEVIRAARGRFDTLRLRTENPEAAAFYEQLGFLRSTGAGDCTHVMTLQGVRWSGSGLVDQVGRRGRRHAR
jgi:GNAT superfamily N-acetyltransferase